jgi:hypothetical protein
VFAVPRSIARSVEKIEKKDLNAKNPPLEPYVLRLSFIAIRRTP